MHESSTYCGTKDTVCTIIPTSNTEFHPRGGDPLIILILGKKLSITLAHARVNVRLKLFYILKMFHQTFFKV